MMPVEQTVAAGLLVQDGKILITRRDRNRHLELYWEFPGGKQKKNESVTDCLIREMEEETGIRVRVGRKIYSTSYRYPDRTIRLNFYLCERDFGTTGERRPSEFRWIGRKELGHYRFPPANTPLIRMLMSDETPVPELD